MQLPESKSLTEQAYNALLDQILSCKLTPGETLHERKLATEFGVSRTPVREAMNRLEVEGLIIRRPHQVPIVKEISIKEFLEALHIRHLLEPEAAGLAAPQFPIEEVTRLRERITRLMKSTEPSAGEHWEVDDDFHGMIASASGNSLLVDIIANLRRKTQMFNLKRMPDRFLPGCHEHLTILTMLAERNAGGARQGMSQHLTNVRQSILIELQKLFQ